MKSSLPSRASSWRITWSMSQSIVGPAKSTLFRSRSLGKKELAEGSTKASGAMGGSLAVVVD